VTALERHPAQLDPIHAANSPISFGVPAKSQAPASDSWGFYTGRP
jgi:hypothetical protein